MAICSGAVPTRERARVPANRNRESGPSINDPILSKLCLVAPENEKPADEIGTVLYPFQVPHFILRRGMIRDDCASDRLLSLNGDQESRSNVKKRKIGLLRIVAFALVIRA